MNKAADIIVVSTACHTAINRNVYKEFSKKGFTVLLIIPKELTFSSRSFKSDEPAVDDPMIEYLDLKGNNPRIARFVGIIKVLTLYRPKIVFLDNDPASIIAVQIGLWAKIYKSKLFCISCENMALDILSAYRKRGLKGAPAAFFKRLLLFISRKLVSGVFTINNEGTQVFKNEKFKNVKKIPLGFDPKYFHIDLSARNLIRSELGVDGFVIGFLGRISHEKGVHVLLSALEAIINYKWTLLIDTFEIYKSKYGQDIHNQIVNSGLVERTVPINPNHDEMGDYINSVDVVVMPSVSTPLWIEQYGRIAAEAMACGKLVIASNTGALPMLLNGRGILFDEGSVGQLKEILKGLIDGSLSQKFTSEEISLYADENLSIDQQMHAMLMFVDETKVL